MNYYYGLCQFLAVWGAKFVGKITCGKFAPCIIKDYLCHSNVASATTKFIMSAYSFYRKLVKNPGEHAPRWVVFSIDLFICATALIISYLLRFNFSIPSSESYRLLSVLTYVLFVRGLMFIVFRTYLGLIRYTSMRDAWRIFTVITSGTAILLAVNLIMFQLRNRFVIPNSVILIDYMGCMLGLIGARIVYKSLYYTISNKYVDRREVIVVGEEQFLAGLKVLSEEAIPGMRVRAFIAPLMQQMGHKISGMRIYDVSELQQLLQTYSIDMVLFAQQNMPLAIKHRIADVCMAAKVPMQTVTNVDSWLSGSGNDDGNGGVKDFNIEDLLMRPPIHLNQDDICAYLRNKTVLITGAAGSIGSELVRQVSQFDPQLIVLFDHAETPLYDIDMELRERLGFLKFELVIGSVTNINRVRRMFEAFSPQVVFHAAAYKHVPMMEENPSEAVFNNVKGTKVIADMAVEFGVEKFVMVSTDKAVNPTNVMGASKRIAEIYTQTLNKQQQHTQFITTRFGNVLGSNGSVIPRFKRQIEQGGPITITHPRITRYFMTIPEASQLVLQAGAMGKGGEIFVFDMGEPVRIVDLARRMISLSGKTEGRDIAIVYSGLRPGEKLYEEVLNDQERTQPTYHPKIMIAQVNEYSAEVFGRIDSLIAALNTDNYDLVAIMKEIVPEYISRNSVFENIDRQKRFSRNAAATKQQA